MSVYIPMIVTLVVWLALWGYIFRLDRKVKDIEKNA